MKGYSYHVEFNVRGARAILGVTTQRNGRVYGPPVALDFDTNNLGNGKEETDNEETYVHCYTSSLRASVLEDSLLL